MDLLAGYSDENSKQSPKLDQTMQVIEVKSYHILPGRSWSDVIFDSKVEKGRSLEEEWASFEKLIDGDYMGETASGKEDITSTSKQLPITKKKFSESNIEETYAFEIQSGSSSSSTSRSNSVEPEKPAESDKVKLETVTVDLKDDVEEILPCQYRPRKTPFQDSGKGSSTSRSRSHSPKRHRKSVDKRSRSRSKDRHRSRKSKKEKSRNRSSSRHKSPNFKRSRSRSKKRSPKRSRSRSKDRKHTRDRKSSRERHRHRSKDRSHRKKHNSPRRQRSKSKSPRKHKSTSRSPRKHRSKSRSPRRHRSKSRSPRRHRSKSRSPHRHRSKSPRRHRSRSRSPWRHRSRSPRRHRRSSYSRSRSRSYSPRSYKSVPVNSYQQKIMGTLAKKSKPLTFREKMRQDLLKASKMLTDQAANGTLADDSDKDGDVYSRIAGTSESGPVTPQMALLQTMAAMHQKAQELTGVTVPRYYNPAAVNPLKYAEQFQKRKLLWSKNKEKKEEKTGDQWQGTSFSSDNDGKMGAKFRKLMGMKEDAAITDDALTEEQKVKREDFFARLDQDYEFARMSTHTHRGVGLGFASQGMSMPQFPQP